MIRPLLLALAVLVTFAGFACTREIVVLDSLSDDYCPSDSSLDGTTGCEAGICPATPSCAEDFD